MFFKRGFPVLGGGRIFFFFFVTTRRRIFTKNGQVAKDRYRFKIGQICLEQVSAYNYLGVDISSSGKFSLTDKNLSLKASRALFSVKQSIFNNSIKPSMLRIFNALVKPIALYNTEVWIGFKSYYKNKTIDEMFEMSLKSFNDFDKIVTRFSKFCFRSTLQSFKFCSVQ